jgi:hypothetical protein
MKKLLFFACLLGLMSSCTQDTGKTQAGLQKIYTALNDGNLQAANSRLAEVNQLEESPLKSDGYTKELYGQVHLLETHELGDSELIIYKLEKHERIRKVNERLNSADFKARQAAGEVKSIDEENGIIVFSERKYAFKVNENGEERYIIEPDEAAMQEHFPNNKDKVQAFVQKHF